MGDDESEGIKLDAVESALLDAKAKSQHTTKEDMAGRIVSGWLDSYTKRFCSALSFHGPNSPCRGKKH